MSLIVNTVLYLLRAATVVPCASGRGASPAPRRLPGPPRPLHGCAMDAHYVSMTTAIFLVTSWRDDRTNWYIVICVSKILVKWIRIIFGRLYKWYNKGNFVFAVAQNVFFGQFHWATGVLCPHFQINLCQISHEGRRRCRWCSKQFRFSRFWKPDNI